MKLILFAVLCVALSPAVAAPRDATPFLKCNFTGSACNSQPLQAKRKKPTTPDQTTTTNPWIRNK